MIDRAASTFNGTDYRIFGFDSFEGLPQAKGIDRDIHVGEDVRAVDFNKGQFAHSREEVWSKLQKELARSEHIQLIEGWYDQVLDDELANSLDIHELSFINVDCDFYESTRVVLNWCKPFIKQGTIINFDDWYCYRASDQHGEMLAFREFLSENSQLTAIPFSQYSWHGQAFIMQRNDGLR